MCLEILKRTIQRFFIGFYNGLGYTGFVSVQGVAAAFLVRSPAFPNELRSPVS